jgi:hypothetical protein
MLSVIVRSSFAFATLLALFACAPPDTDEADTQGEQADEGMAEPLLDRCDPSLENPCAGYVGESH